ncbi:hypothetical protein KC19_1G159900 [Ceratodon purpureus]|uniref:Uncharacterized protein n=1 Tax=Ceratodon purpureus TaxID=3225 RepID=A0A8T0J6Q8_CERPU|nr:hypothetical protein KC19_1G159900 [Ceratodon purpureus]
MLPTHHRSDGKWDKWGVNNMSKLLALALVLLLSLQILTWDGRSLLQIPCPFRTMDSPPLSTPIPSPNSDDKLYSITQAVDSPALTPNCTQVKDELNQTDYHLKQKVHQLNLKDHELKQKDVELKQKDVELKQKNDELKQKEDELKQEEEKLKLMQDELKLTKGQLQLTQDQLPPPSPPPLPPNSYFSDADSDIWACRQHHINELNMTYHDWVTTNFTDQQALCAAHRHAKRPMAPGTPRIAFLFLTRGPIATEPIWRKFFSGHEDKYSIYVHATDPKHEYAADSLFHNRTIPSKPFNKVRASLPEAMRRLLSYALLDSSTPNAWFHILCDSSIPIRSFPYAYDYITNSDKSFVEAFYPASEWWRANWRDAKGDMVIPDQFMRKGEAWVTVHRRHAGLIVGDHYVFPRFKHHWFEWGIPSELYIPTLLTLADPQSVANHTLVYVNWVNSIRLTSSPVMYNKTSVSPELIQGIQNLTSNLHGFYQIDKMWNDTTEKTCVYNGVPNSPCFLFARKFNGEDDNIAKLMSLSAVLGYA